MRFKKITSTVEINEFVSAWEKVFQRKLENSVYAWIFSKRNNIYCCFDGDQLIAGYCLLDIKVLIKGKIRKGVLCNNIFVNGFKYQKLGVFQKITEYALNDVTSKGYEFALGFPNNKAIKAHLRSGWLEGDTLPFFEIKGKILFKKTANIKWYSKGNNKVLEEIYSLMQHKYKDFSFSVLKDPEFLVWRFNMNPRWEYDIGCIYDNNILKTFFVSKFFKEKGRVHLVDYYFDNKLDLEQALSAIYSKYELERQLNINCIDLWCARGDQAIFNSVGFSQMDEGSYVIYKDLQEKGMKVGSMPHLTLADNDVF